MTKKKFTKSSKEKKFQKSSGIKTTTKK